MLFHGKLNLAPIEAPKRVLDLATGMCHCHPVFLAVLTHRTLQEQEYGQSTSVCTVTFPARVVSHVTANLYPDATVIGTDLSPVQRDVSVPAALLVVHHD